MATLTFKFPLITLITLALRTWKTTTQNVAQPVLDPLQPANMSSILLLLDDGEMQQLGANTGGRIVLAGNQGDPGAQFSDAVITSADGGQLTLGSHFLTTTDGAGGEQVRVPDRINF